MTKKKWIIIGTAVLVLIGILLAVFLWLIPTLSQPEEPQVKNTPKQAIHTVMKALAGEGTSERVLLGADGTPVSIAPGSGIAQLITSKIEYKVTAVDTVDDTTMRASLEITAPDALAAVRASLEGMQTYEESAFLDRMTQHLLNADAVTTFNIQVELVLVEDRWCVVTNPAFSDAITGGLITRYAQIQQEIMDAFAGGEGE
jgi:hypothetical protein